MEHEGDHHANCDWCFWYSHQRIITGTGGLGSTRMSGDHPNYNIIENGQNIEKSPGELRTCCFSNSNERSSDNANVKNSNE